MSGVGHCLWGSPTLCVTLRADLYLRELFC